MGRFLIYLSITLAAVTMACSSRPVIMKSTDVKVSRDEPSSSCKDMGRITGTTLSIHATSEDALEDLKTEASRKGANYVKVGEFSDTGTAVAGVAYICP